VGRVFQSVLVIIGVLVITSTDWKTRRTM